MAVELKSIEISEGITNKGFDEDMNGQIKKGKIADNDATDEATAEISERQNRNVVCIVRRSIYEQYKNHEVLTWIVFKVLVLLLFLAYFAYCMYVKFGDEGSIRLLVLTVFILLIILTKLSRKYTRNVFENIYKTAASAKWKKGIKIARWFMYVAMSIFMIVYIIVDVAMTYTENLISLAAIVLLVLIFYVTSTNPESVNWHVVFWGITLQFVFAVVILRTVWGYSAFKYVGDRVVEFIEHADAGASFYFGDNFRVHFVAFAVSATIIFFVSVISVLQYLGAMRVIVGAAGRFLAFCTGASPAESICAVANIFLGMDAGPLMLRHHLPDLSNSELHSIMVGGFATIAGSVMGAYILMGIPANHMISASVMSAPAALALGKLSYPETRKTKVSTDIYSLPPSKDRNIFEAASNGALSSLRILGGIFVNLIAFISLLHFVNMTVAWFGDRAGVELSLEIIFSYLFYPISYFIGIPGEDRRQIAMLLGVKTTVNEFAAFERMSVLLKNRDIWQNYTNFFNVNVTQLSGSDMYLPMTNEILVGGVLQPKSVVIGTYALCGFANFGAIGTMLGVLGAIAPNRRKDLSNMVFRAMIVGNVASFLTAAIAGLLYKDVIEI